MRTKIIPLLAALALSSPAWAQPGPGPGGGRRMARTFDPATVTTVSGEVTEVRKLEGRRGEGTHVTLKAHDATYDVHLGPAAFLASKKLEVKQGDQIEVTGSKVELGGKPALIAQTVKKGDTAVTLRDANGVPAWARGPGRK